MVCKCQPDSDGAVLIVIDTAEGSFRIGASRKRTSAARDTRAPCNSNVYKG